MATAGDKAFPAPHVLSLDNRPEVRHLLKRWLSHIGQTYSSKATLPARERQGARPSFGCGPYILLPENTASLRGEEL